MTAVPSPSRPHLIFIHGAGVGPWMWDKQQQYFEPDFAVHTPTLPGHGTFDGSLPGDAEFVSHAHAAESIARQVALDTLEGDVVVIGFSLGGQVAIHLATMFPDTVTRVVVVSSLLRPWRVAGLYVRAAILATPHAKSENLVRAQAHQLSIADEHFDDYFALSTGMTKRTVGTIIRANFAFAPSTSFVRSDRPVLILAGATEQRRLREDSVRLTEKLSQGTMVLVDGVGHGASLAQPDQFNQLVGDWVNTVAGDIHHNS